MFVNDLFYTRLVFPSENLKELMFVNGLFYTWLFFPSQGTDVLQGSLLYTAFLSF